MKKIALIVCLVISSVVISQDKIEKFDYETFRQELDELTRNKEFDKIIFKIEKVNKNDSTYSNLLLSKSYYFMQLQNFKDAVNTTKTGLQLQNRTNRQPFYLNQFIAYWNLDEKDNAIKTLDEALIEFPANAQFYYYKGLLFNELNKFPEALEMLKLSAIYDPFNADVHLKIGNLFYKQRLIAQALICFNTYLLLNPEEESAFTVLNSLDKLLALKNENEKSTDFTLSESSELFEEIDLILNNKVALNADYKVDNEININFVKQNHALIQTISSVNTNNDYWDTKYVKLHQWISDNNYFDDFIYTTTFSIKNPKFKKIVDAKTQNVNAFLLKFKEKWVELNEEVQLKMNEKNENVNFLFTDYKLDGIGSKKNGEMFGLWAFYNQYGKIISKGNFNEQGNRIGKWEWYFLDGTINETVNYLNGKLEGERKENFNNGNAKIISNYNNDLLNGEYKTYNFNGSLLEQKYFINGELNDYYKSFYPVENTPKSVINYSKDKPTGTAKEYYPNGSLLFEVPFKDGNKYGVEKNYFANDTLLNAIEMVDEKMNGTFKSYYKNGILKDEGTVVDNKNEGLWKLFYPNGKLQNEYTYIKNKLHGSFLEYSPTGKLYSDFTYKNDELIAYKFFNALGEILKEGRKKGGEFYYEGFSYYGAKVSEGNYNVEGGKDGEWKFYDKNGLLASKGNYVNNKLQGEYIEYYSNGSVKTISNYVDDVITDYYVSYYPNHNMSFQGYYKKGIQQNEWRNYYNNGTLKAINYYHNGELHGEQDYFTANGKPAFKQNYNYGHLELETSFNAEGNQLNEVNFKESDNSFTVILYHSNKKILSETDYSFGLKHGSYIEYDFYGNKILEGEFLNDKAYNKWQWYYPNRIIQREATYLNGDLNGTIYDYYENGNLERVYEYVLGDLNGISISYAEDGKTITATTQYINGLNHGRKVFYSEEGKLQIIRFYEFDRLIGYSYLDKNGNELPMIEIINETAKMKSYFDNGHVAREMEVINGNIENNYIANYYNGKVQNKHVNKNDDYEGNYVLYFKNGAIKEEIEYKDGERNGISKKYYENGQLKESISYINNEKNSIAKYYDITGKFLKTEHYFNNYIYEVEQN